MHSSEQAAIEQTPVGQWTYFGACVYAGWPQGEHEQVSVNIFQVVAKARGQGKKKSKGVYRVGGPSTERARILADAQAICDELNALSFTLDSSETWMDVQARRIAQAVMAERKAQR